MCKQKETAHQDHDKDARIADQDHHEKLLSDRAKRRSPLWHVELIKEQLIVRDALLLKCQHGPVREGACSTQSLASNDSFTADKDD